MTGKKADLVSRRCHVLFERQKTPTNVLPVQENVHYSGSRALKISEPQFLIELAFFIEKRKLLSL